jgi:GntR family transcriptional regulator
MVIRIDPASRDPLFTQIVESVKRDVGTGRLKPGDRLPSVRDLAKDLVINPNTIAKAYQVLEAEGVTVSRRGAGTFIADRRPRLAAGERRRRLGAAMDALLSEAVHLGLTEEEIRAALEAAIEQYRRGLARQGEAG